MAHPKIGGCSSAGVSATPMDLKVSATPLDSKCDSKCDSKHIGLPARLMDPFGPSNFAYTFESRIVSPVLPPNFGSAHYKRWLYSASKLSQYPLVRYIVCDPSIQPEDAATNFTWFNTLRPFDAKALEGDLKLVPNSTVIFQLKQDWDLICKSQISLSVNTLTKSEVLAEVDHCHALTPPTKNQIPFSVVEISEGVGSVMEYLNRCGSQVSVFRFSKEKSPLWESVNDFGELLEQQTVGRGIDLVVGIENYTDLQFLTCVCLGFKTLMIGGSMVVPITVSPCIQSLIWLCYGHFESVSIQPISGQSFLVLVCRRLIHRQPKVTMPLLQWLSKAEKAEKAEKASPEPLLPSVIPLQSTILKDQPFLQFIEDAFVLWWRYKLYDALTQYRKSTEPSWLSPSQQLVLAKHKLPPSTLTAANSQPNTIPAAKKSPNIF